MQITRDIDLERRLSKALAGEVRFDAFTRGRYATDASIYQIMPQGVVFPESADDIAATLELARQRGVPVILRGGGTSLWIAPAPSTTSSPTTQTRKPPPSVPASCWRR
jgi:FAD/FMN-containing dehydrogenase